MTRKIFLKSYLLFVFIVLLFVGDVFGEKYERIISLAPSITESLYELGMDKEIIGISFYCPKGKSKKEIIGTLLEPDIEKIMMLKPDLIISSKEGNSKTATEKMQRLGLNVFVTETSANFKDICVNFMYLAQKVGKGEKGKTVIKRAEKEISDIYLKTRALVKQKVFWEVGAKPLYTAGKMSFVNDYNYYTSTVNIYADINSRYPPVNIEDIIRRNPDIIIMVNMGDISLDEMRTWKKYDMISAVKNEKVFMLEANDIFTPTPLTFAKGVAITARAIFPELFSDE